MIYCRSVFENCFALFFGLIRKFLALIKMENSDILTIRLEIRGGYMVLSTISIDYTSTTFP